MIPENCEVCGYQSQLGAIERHHIVPADVVKQAGVANWQAVRLCCNCHKEVHTWYSSRVSNMAYDPKSKKFRARSWLEIIDEYKSAYTSFVTYKKGR